MMDTVWQGLIGGFFFGLTVFVIKRDLGRLSGKVDALAERHHLCRESLFRDFVSVGSCREHREEADEKVGNLFGRIKEVEERTSRLNGFMAGDGRSRL